MGSELLRNISVVLSKAPNVMIRWSSSETLTLATEYSTQLNVLKTIYNSLKSLLTHSTNLVAYKT